MPPREPPEKGGLGDTLRALKEARRGPPTEADIPPPSSLPMTPAARAALRLSKGKRRGA
jgi:hypothetical protein